MEVRERGFADCDVRVGGGGGSLCVCKHALWVKALFTRKTKINIVSAADGCMCESVHWFVNGRPTGKTRHPQTAKGRGFQWKLLRSALVYGMLLHRCPTQESVKLAFSAKVGLHPFSLLGRQMDLTILVRSQNGSHSSTVNASIWHPN